jgi:hypothetical protein
MTECTAIATSAESFGGDMLSDTPMPLKKINLESPASKAVSGELVSIIVHG